MLGGRLSEREKGRFEITRVPPILKDRDRLIGRSDPILDRYARITFDKDMIKGKQQAELVAPDTRWWIHWLMLFLNVSSRCSRRVLCWWMKTTRARMPNFLSTSNTPYAMAACRAAVNHALCRSVYNSCS